MTASVLKKRSKTHKRLKERFLLRRNRTKRANFRGSPLFQASYNNKNKQTEKQTINSTYLNTASCPFPSASLPHPTDTSYIVCFSVCLLLFFVVVVVLIFVVVVFFVFVFVFVFFVRSLKKRTSLKMCMLCPVSSN